VAALVVATAAAVSAVAYAGHGVEAAKTPPTISNTAFSAARGACHDGTSRPYRHVIWIWMENQNYDSIIGSKEAPFINRLATDCGLATNYHNITHPSLPNYIAATSGSLLGITDDCNPSECPRRAQSLFGQVDAAGLAWRAYAESMPAACALHSGTGSNPRGDYTAHHNPAAYYLPLRPRCASTIVPLGTPSSGALARALRADSLPSFSFMIPNNCNNMHDCGIADGDRWLSRWVAAIVSSPAYQARRTVVFVTWDEGEKQGSKDCAFDTSTPGCHVVTIVVSPSTRPGTRVARLFNHYSLLKSTEQLLGLTPFLGQAKAHRTGSMLQSFNLR
jgi:phospholipase C